MAHKKKKKDSGNTIAINKKARFEYHLQDRMEAGISLMGWEVKSLKQGRINFDESFILLEHGQAFLYGTHITALPSASTHVKAEPLRTRRLLLHKKEIMRLQGLVDRKGMTVVPTSLYWKKGKIKVEIAIAQGKQMHDKRASSKERDWNRDKQRILKHG